MERDLMTWERKILRKIYGTTYENGYWRIEMNQEIYNKFKPPNILIAIKVRRLEWLGHFVRMDGARRVKK
jgi:ubiquitin-protein ligase